MGEPMKRTPEQTARHNRARLVVCWATCIAQKRRLETAAAAVVGGSDWSAKCRTMLRLAASHYTAAAAQLLGRIAATGRGPLPVPGQPQESSVRALLDAVGVTADALDDVLGDLFLASNGHGHSDLAARHCLQVAINHVESARECVKRAEAVRHA